MKKLILLLMIVPMLQSCDPCLGQNNHKGEMYLKNSTEQTLRVFFPWYSTPVDVVPADSVNVANKYLVGCLDPEYPRLKFEDMFGWTYSDELYIDVLSEDDVLRKRWDHLDKDSPGKQFFNESYWVSYERFSPNELIPITAWVFEVLPEDIQPNRVLCVKYCKRP